MASTLTVDNIVGATTVGNVKIPGTIVQVVGRTGGDRVTTGNLNTWTGLLLQSLTILNF
jgi:hypothetical protein